jgi:hypothetical protein
MGKQTISFAIVSFSLLILSGCNHANQNTYAAASSPPVSPKQAEILQMCNSIYSGYMLSGGDFGSSMARANTARADCLIKAGYYKD